MNKAKLVAGITLLMLIAGICLASASDNTYTIAPHTAQCDSAKCGNADMIDCKKIPTFTWTFSLFGEYGNVPVHQGTTYYQEVCQSKSPETPAQICVENAIKCGDDGISIFKCVNNNWAYQKTCSSTQKCSQGTCIDNPTQPVTNKQNVQMPNYFSDEEAYIQQHGLTASTNDNSATQPVAKAHMNVKNIALIGGVLVVLVLAGIVAYVFKRK